MLKLTADPRTALENGEPVPCVLENTQCVIVRKDVFDRLQRVTYDDSEWRAEEMIAIAERAFDDAHKVGPIE